jgi:hypothetical protein
MVKTLGGNRLGIKYINTDGWNWVKESALTTIHKNSIEGKEISSEWKMSILRSEHSPIRELSIRFKILDIKRWISDQLVRHKQGVEHYVGTMRSDRGSKPREEQTMADLTQLMQSHNAQSFTNMARTRLCVGCVSKETLALTKDLINELSEIEPEVAFYCVPPCIYRGACKEVGFTKCNYYYKFVDSLIEDDKLETLIDIDMRYKAYHEWCKNSI